MAAVLAGSLAFLVYRRLRLSAAHSNLIQVVAAAEAVPPGITLTAKNLTLIDWPADVPLAGSFTKTEEVVGRPLLFPLGPKEPVLKRDLAIAGSGIGLSGKIPPGMRATAVRSNEVVGVAGFLFPGSHVDVLATYNQPGTAQSPGTSTSTQTVLQDVEVLAAGQTIEPDPTGKAQTVNVVTLLLSPEDSQKLLVASSQATIQFVLRSGADEGKVDIKPTRLDEVVGVPKASAPPPAPRPATITPRRKPAPPVSASAPPPPVHTLEVIQGTERTVHKF